jgi:hypothetical protein
MTTESKIIQNPRKHSGDTVPASWAYRLEAELRNCVFLLQRCTSDEHGQFYQGPSQDDVDNTLKRVDILLK